jgi:uncharacterized protein (TIGR02246 family)
MVLPVNRTQRARALAVFQQLLEAWNSRRAADFAALFADDGNAVGFDGSQLDGRTGISDALGGIFANHPTAAYVAKVREVREVGQGVTLIRAVVGMVPPGSTELNPAVNAIQSVILVDHDGEQRIALLHSTPAAFHGRPELVEALTRELTDVLGSGRTVAE